MLRLPENFNGGALPSISLSGSLPLPIGDIPPRVIQVSYNLPFILFLQKYHIPYGSKVPEKVFVLTTGKWMILMFHTLVDSQRAVGAKPWLGAGILID